MKLAAHRYGKGRVRVMKVLREGAAHAVKELTVAVSLEGDFAPSFTAADNSRVVPTDTIKNIVNALAHERLQSENEPFADHLATHFLERYSQVARVHVELEERIWTRLRVGETLHPHTFVHADRAAPVVRLRASATGRTLESGIRELLILKSTGSGFEHFPRCEHTTLAETTDRILATALSASWRWAKRPDSYSAANAAIVQAMLEPFAMHYSPSVQATLFEMGTAALDISPGIESITLTMPNLHCLRIDLSPFGLENANQVFVPTDEPHGQIEATVVRE